jgi:hypothetical protein
MIITSKIQNAEKSVTTSVILFVLLFTGSFSTGAQNVKNILGYVDISDFDPEIPLEEHSYLIPGTHLMIRDQDYIAPREESYDHRIRVVPSGMRNIRVQYLDIITRKNHIDFPQSGYIRRRTETRTYYEKSDFIYVAATLEAGKYYTFKYEEVTKGKGMFKSVENIKNVSAVEIIDGKMLDFAKRNIAITKDYLLANPRRNTATANNDMLEEEENFDVLDGTYKTNTKSGGRQKKITFEGDRIYISAPLLGTGNDRVFEGTYRLKGKTIVINDKDILQYKLNDDVLDILEIRRGIIPAVEGRYILSQNTVSDFSAANPGILDGYYENEDGRFKITIEGNWIRLSIQPKKIVKIIHILEGTLEYDENTLTIHVESLNGKPRNVEETLSYKLYDDGFDITDGKLHIAAIPTPVQGQYYKYIK